MRLNPQTGYLEFLNNIPEYNEDPESPAVGDAWILAEPIYSAGSPMGLLLLITASMLTGYNYYLKYRTQANVTISVSLT